MEENYDIEKAILNIKEKYSYDENKKDEDDDDVII